MRIRVRYLEGKPVEEKELWKRPVRSQRIEEIFADVRRRVGE